MIKRLELKNFTAFYDLGIDFSPGLNVIIGENGTGKTHLLKAAYAICSAHKDYKNIDGNVSDYIREALTAKLISIFLPYDKKLGKLCGNGLREHAKVNIEYFTEKRLAFQFYNNSESVDIASIDNFESYNNMPVFIPTKEVLTLLRGVSDDNCRSTVCDLFDGTYIDLCNFLLKDIVVSPDERVEDDPRFGAVFKKATNTINGKFQFKDFKFYFKSGSYQEQGAKKSKKDDDIAIITDKIDLFVPDKDGDISNNMTAEGFRKIGILQQLLANKSIEPGVSGPLFWDEPEANMNPKLMEFVVRILLSLSRYNQQIIITTHDYVLLKWIDLLLNEESGNNVRFHVLYHKPIKIDQKEVLAIKVDSTDSYSQIKENSISNTYSVLYDAEIERALGRKDK